MVSGSGRSQCGGWRGRAGGSLRPVPLLVAGGGGCPASPGRGACGAGPVLDRSFRLTLTVVGVMTAVVSSSSTTVRITICLVARSVTAPSSSSRRATPHRERGTVGPADEQRPVHPGRLENGIEVSDTRLEGVVRRPLRLAAGPLVVRDVPPAGAEFGDHGPPRPCRRRGPCRSRSRRWKGHAISVHADPGSGSTATSSQEARSGSAVRKRRCRRAAPR
jgi:hypothetical protein